MKTRRTLSHPISEKKGVENYRTKSVDFEN